MKGCWFPKGVFSRVSTVQVLADLVGRHIATCELEGALEGPLGGRKIAALSVDPAERAEEFRVVGRRLDSAGGKRQGFIQFEPVIGKEVGQGIGDAGVVGRDLQGLAEKALGFLELALCAAHHG